MITVDSATGGPWEVMGDLIKSSGKEDCSWLRRCLAGHLADLNHEGFARQLPISQGDFDALRARFVEELGAPPGDESQRDRE